MNRSKKHGERGISTRAALGVAIVFVIGVALGVGLNYLLYPPGEGAPSENYQQVLSRLGELEGKVQSLELVLDNYSNQPVGDNLEWSVPALYQRTVKSVVKIEVSKTTQGLFGPQESTALGSGFVYNASGYIISNEHVVGGADEINVTFYNGDTVEADPVATDPYSDIGVVKINPEEVENLRPLPLGSSSDLQVGERVVAIGNPFGLSRTVTTGVVSQKDRLLQTQTGYSIPSVIQIDAAINPGSSGGPLLDFQGRAIGITTAIETQTGTFTGVGFAVPSDLIRKVVTGLIERGEYRHPWIGVGGQNVTFETAKERGLDKARGFLISYIESDSPAEDAGLQEEDIILEIEDRKIFGLEDILSYIELNTRPGDTITLQIYRDGETTDIDLTLGTRPALQ